MAITYPLAMPSMALAQVNFQAVDAVAYSQSPFTFSGQSHHWGGQMLRVDVTLPAMGRATAEEWVAFLLALKGQKGTFLLGDPVGSTPRGSAGGSPLVKGAGQTGDTLLIDGATASQVGWLRAGDYVQLGAASTATLHKVLADVDSDGSGNAALDLWPAVRVAPADNAALTLTDAVGLFRLASNTRDWATNQARHFGISFSAMGVN